ncbi:cyclic nucleotide-binding domain-containing protein [Aestuariivirga litoralis]|uniref:cyclic nucleotide-binding domain-containing protein n=1 Tax=Aestuariivirga litoralis TaxID=2650924 RepID=UPI0018C56829|nr:cyclic nucleotide-binding domain-containing protein [Aestuariivirga litoralis]MBG1233444.1 cyclic nucleotide-binding domain-containing protein [Aestuariivirga litoralis]
MTSILDKCDPQRLQNFPNGTVLLPEGARTGKLHILKSGTVEILRGETQVAVISDEGAVFGEMSVLLGTPHTATVRALTDCETYLYEDAAAFMAKDAEIALAIAAMLAQRLNNATTYLADVKNQYADSGNHLSMVSSVLASLVNQPAKNYDPGSDREPDLQM